MFLNSNLPDLLLEYLLDRFPFSVNECTYRRNLLSRLIGLVGIHYFDQERISTCARGEFRLWRVVIGFILVAASYSRLIKFIQEDPGIFTFLSLIFLSKVNLRILFNLFMGQIPKH